MGNSLRKIKSGRETIAFPARQNGKMAVQVMEAWNRGFSRGQGAEEIGNFMIV